MFMLYENTFDLKGAVLKLIDNDPSSQPFLVVFTRNTGLRWAGVGTELYRYKASDTYSVTVVSIVAYTY